MVLIGSCAGTYYAIDKQTGKVRWSYDIHKDGNQTSFHGNPLILGDLVIIGTDGEGVGHVYAFNIKTGEPAWKYAVTAGNGGYGVSTDIVNRGSCLYGVTIGDELICLDLQTGRLNWSFQKPYAKEGWFWSSAPTIEGDRIYFGALSGSMYALDAQTGKTIWSTDLGSRITSSAVFTGQDLCVGTEDHHIYKLERKTGKVIAKLVLDRIAGGPFISSSDGLLVTEYESCYTQGENSILSIDPAKMAVRWRRQSAAGWTMRQPVVYGSTVLAGSSAGELSAFSLADGALQWSDHIHGTIRSIGIGGDNMLYIGTLSGTVYAYELAAKGVK